MTYPPRTFREPSDMTRSHPLESYISPSLSHIYIYIKYNPCISLRVPKGLSFGDLPPHLKSNSRPQSSFSTWPRLRVVESRVNGFRVWGLGLQKGSECVECFGVKGLGVEGVEFEVESLGIEDFGAYELRI